MRQRIAQGAELDFATPDEVGTIVRNARKHEQITRIRASATIVLDPNGLGTVEVYKVPIGYEFAVRRVSLNVSGAPSPLNGQVAVIGGTAYVVYQRSGLFVEYGQPQYCTAYQVPGVQTWGDQQGPALSNGEVFEVRVVFGGGSAGNGFTAAVEGLLRRPALETPPTES